MIALVLIVGYLCAAEELTAYAIVFRLAALFASGTESVAARHVPRSRRAERNLRLAEIVAHDVHTID
jgi:hypothetical protein